ncbi:MAG: PP0621 family protein [Burkholderiales bacterium]
MAKFLLLIAVFIIIYLILRANRRRSESPLGPPTHQPEDMVRCKVCGLHLPRSESLTLRGEFFCSQEHLRLASKESSQR